MFVSVIVPTYNRRKFIPLLIDNFLRQDYPQDKMELLIADDGEDKIEDLIPDKKNIKYFKFETKIQLGKKRNFLNDHAKGDIIVCMDDDDYYPPTRVSHAVDKLVKNDALVAGCSKAYICYLNLENKPIYSVGPFARFHATNGTLAYNREYLKNHRHKDADIKSEESRFLNNFKDPLIQLDPLKTILVIGHDSNTVDKRKILQKKHAKLKLTLTEMKLKDWLTNNAVPRGSSPAYEIFGI